MQQSEIPVNISQLDRVSALRASGSELARQSHLRIVMIAYACSPKRGGEHLLGWNWAYRLAERGHKVIVLTAAHRLAESEGERPATLEVVGVHDQTFAFLRKIGLLGKHAYYMLWNHAAARAAKRLTGETTIDVVHQCTFHTFRFACFPALWGTNAVIWGPIAGLERIPRSLFPTLGWHVWGELIRSLANALQLHQPSIRRCLTAADHVIVSNYDTARALEKILSRRYEYLPANAVELPPLGDYVAPGFGQLDVIAVGAIVPMRPYSLVLRAIAEIPSEHRAQLSLTFIGEGPSEPSLKKQVRSLGLEKNVAFLGPQSRKDTLARMRAAHLLVFPSLRDSGSSSVTEAMSMGLPVLGFALAGPGAMLANGGGFVMKSQTPAGLIAEIRQCLERLLDHPELLQPVSQEGRAAAANLFQWTARISRMEDLYRSAIISRAKKSGPHHCNNAATNSCATTATA